MTYSAALAEAYASAPAVQVYHTLEIRHPLISPPVRVVQGWSGINAKLEADAPENPGETVEFIAFAFDVHPPEVAPGGSPRMTIELTNISRTILAAVEQAMESTDPIRIMWRQYMDSGLTVGPENNPPIDLVMTSIHATPMQISLECGFPDMGQKKFPAITYSPQTFPGLIQ
ncbi:MAG: DUF1833 family protein [Magnetococcales bacterium]|nr:DUF1833 family protein [Magnetococcales bacterium]